MPDVLQITSSGYKVRGCASSIPGWVLKKEKSQQLIYVLYILYVIYIVYILYVIYIVYILYVIYIVYILYAYYISYILHIYVESKVSGI